MSQDYKMKLAQNIKKLRLSKKLTREELSLALGVDNSYISKVEKAKVNITIDRIQSIADYFNTDFLKLFR